MNEVAVTENQTDRLIEVAFKQAVPIEQMQQLFDLKLKADAAFARNAYVKAMAQFKRTPPRVVKNKTVSFSGTSYTHATLGTIAEVVIPALAEHGFSHRWINDQSDQISVTCVITHELGHSEQNTLRARPDDSGKKNPIQQVASAVTYLQRYTLLGALGLATHDQGDDDSRAAYTETGEVFHLEDWLPTIAGANEEATLTAIYWDMVNAMKAAKDTSALQRVKDACAARKAEILAGKEPERVPGQEG